jgi:hypothetical protein
MRPERLRLLNERFITRKTNRANSWVPPTVTVNDGYELKISVLKKCLSAAFSRARVVLK